MKITKKFIPFVLAGFLGMLITACGNPNTSSAGSSSSSEAPITKQDPTITIGLVEGEQYEVDGFKTPTITVTPETLTHTVTYYKGGTSVGSDAPTETGDYTITVTTTETAEYNAGSLSKSFLLRHIPTLTFYYGDDVPLADGHQFRVGEELNIYAKSSVETAVITYTYSDAAGTTLDAAPVEEGVYFLNASVARTDTIGSATASISFELLPAVVKENPTITFYWDGTEINTKESHWLTGSYATSSFYVDEFDLSKLTYEVTDGVEYSTQYEINEAPVTLTDPLTPATYAFKITTVENDNYLSAIDWVLFEVKARPVKEVPTITFYWDGVAVNTKESHWLAGSYAASCFYVDEFDLSKLTYEVTDGVEYTSQYEVNEAPVTLTDPITPATYAFKITTTESDTHISVVDWVLFEVKERPQKVAPTITFFWKGEAVNTKETHWLAGSYAASSFYVDEFDLDSLTYEVTTGVTYTTQYEIDEVPVTLTDPLTPATYAFKITTTEDSTYTSVVDWVLFEIKARPQKTVPTITFSYNGEKLDFEADGDHWWGEGWANSQHYSDEFDIEKLTYEVSDGLTGKATLTLDEATIEAPTNPLKPGTYALTVAVEETDTTTAASTWLLFIIKDKSAPKISFAYNGTAIDTSSNHWIGEGYGDSQYDAADFDVTKLTYAVTDEIAATVTWTLNEAPIEAPTNPLAPGTYAMTVTVTAGEGHLGASDYVLFVIKEAIVPTITFKYDGAEVDIDGNHWWGEGWSDSKFYDTEFDIEKLTYEVSDGLTGTASWTLDEAPIEAPTNPLKAGTYALTVAVGATTDWLLFIIEEAPAAEVIVPEITFSYKGNAVNTTENHWIGEGYGDSQYEASEFDLAALTYSVTNDLPATVTWTLNEVPCEAPTQETLKEGTYAMTVTVAGTDTNTEASNYVLFVIKAPAVIAITFYYDGVALDADGNHWWGEGYGDSQFALADFDLSKLTWEITGTTETPVVTWTLAEIPCAAPTQDTLTTGVYAVTVTVGGVANWLLFAII